MVSDHWAARAATTSPRLPLRRAHPSPNSSRGRRAAQSLREFPILNASLDGERILVKKDIHLGVAVALQTGLVVPVIRGADRIPHSVRAMVPASARRGLRKALGRER